MRLSGVLWSTARLSLALLLVIGCAGRQPMPPPAREAEGRAPKIQPTPEVTRPVAADSVPLADLRTDLRYDVDLAVVDTMGRRLLRADVTVTNTSPRSVRLVHSDCVVELLAYRDSTRAARPPVWNSRRRASWPTATPYGCALPRITAHLAPGESYHGSSGGVGQLRAAIEVAQIYADSLPTGRYFFDARLNLNRDTVRVRAGSAVLPSSPFHLGSEYPLDGFHYRVETEKLAANAQSYTVRLHVSNAGMRRDLTRYVARECPIVLHAYRSAEAQRTAPPRPVWVSPRRCARTPEPVRLREGESRTLTRRFTAREVLGDSLRPGTYYFTAVVPLVDPRMSALSRRVWLDAGAFNLRR